MLECIGPELCFETYIVMSGSLLIWAVLAVAMFWSVGVYNRLMRMRARAGSALGSVEKYMKQFAELLHAHLATLGDPPQTDNVDLVLGHQTIDWKQLAACLDVLDSALKEVRGAPLAKHPLVRLGVAFDALQQAWSSLCCIPDDRASVLIPEAMRIQWEVTTQKVRTARGGLNQILSKYNEAIDQFPARLVAGVARFEPAGLL